jgi:hypothetical protein
VKKLFPTPSASSSATSATPRFASPKKLRVPPRPTRLCGKSIISNLQSPISNLQSPISNLQSPISNPQSPISNLQSTAYITSQISLRVFLRVLRNSAFRFIQKKLRVPPRPSRLRGGSKSRQQSQINNRKSTYSTHQSLFFFLRVSLRDLRNSAFRFTQNSASLCDLRAFAVNP